MIPATLTEHFSPREVMRSQRAARLGIPNEPNDEQWLNAHELAVTCLEPARAALGPLWVSSWFRCAQLNGRTPGSSQASKHMSAEAADVEPMVVGVTTGDLLRWLRKNVPFDKLIWEYGGAWVHVQHLRGQAQRGIVLKTSGTVDSVKYIEIFDEEIEQLGRAA